MVYRLTFGKHKGKSLEWLFFNDPGYVWWMEGNGADRNLPVAARERLSALRSRAKRLRIPHPCPFCKKRPISRMFVTQHISGGIGRVDFDCDECAPEGLGSVEVPPGFYTPDLFRGYDKTGARFLIEAIKYAYFRDSSYRMTQPRLEAFFDNPKNFEGGL